MTFSANAKSELTRIALDKECCELAELSAIMHTAGTISISGGAFSLRIDTENPAVARRIFLLVKSLYGLHIKTQMQTNQLKHNHIYSLYIDKSIARMVAQDTRLIGSEGIRFGADETFISSTCCRIAFVRGAFLGGGSITNPERRYHMEFVCSQEEFADSFLYIISELGITAKSIIRNKSHVVYLKESDAIVTLLTMMGAHSTILKIENIRVVKSVRNKVNRKVNCETGNLSKTVNASVMQQVNIAYIKAHLGLEQLDDSLVRVAEARLANPQASLGELQDLLGAASKSGVNHKLRKLNSIAEQLKNDKGRRI
jgi:DNA-binding protein WhiA